MEFKEQCDFCQLDDKKLYAYGLYRICFVCKRIEERRD